jgi:DNA polymerase
MITFDIESRSEVDVTRVGSHQYWEHPSTELLCLSYKEDDMPTVLWLPVFPPPPWERLVAKHRALEAYNVMFERCFWEMYAVPKLGWPAIPEEYWYCTAAKAAIHRLPRSLAGVAKALDLATQKDAEGKRVMMQLAKPRKPTKNNLDKWFGDTEKFRRLYSYNGRDVDTERAVSNRLADLSPYERRVWQLDQKMNRLGICCDLPAIELILNQINDLSLKYEEQIQILTNYQVSAPTEVAKIRAWCEAQGYPLPDMTKATVAAHVDNPVVPEPIRKILEIRKKSSFSSTAKYKSMARYAHPRTHRIRDALVYHGAGPGRWTGKGAQPHNYPRNALEETDVNNVISLISSGGLDAVRLVYGPPLEILSRCLRGMLIAAPGSTLLCQDYSSIEARGTAWISRQDSILDVFRQGKDIYRFMASQFFGIPYTQITEDQRKFGKVQVLGLGYGMQADGFQAYCLRDWRMNISAMQSATAVGFFKRLNPKTVKYWHSLNKCVTRAVETGRPQRHDRTYWFLENGFLFCQLPSGRCNAYHGPRIELKRARGGGSYPQVKYWHVNPENKQWCETHGWYGKWTENVVQATARDVMVDAMLRLDAAGYRIVLTVHDEILIEYPHPEYAEQALADVARIMTTPPSWAPDFPITVDGWFGKRYRK